MTVRYTRTAARQIEKTLDYIHTRSPNGAVSISGRIRAAISLIEQHPMAGQVTTRAGVRRFPLTPYPYIIFYRADGGDIVVLRFRHAARKPAT